MKPFSLKKWCLLGAAVFSFGFGVSLLGATPTQAQKRVVAANPHMGIGYGESNTARRIDLVAGKSMMIDLPRDAREVFVANPAIANAVVRTAKRIYIIGLDQGATHIFVNDGDGQQIATLEVNVTKEQTRNLQVLRDVLRTALPKAIIEVKNIGDNIALVGQVDSALEAQRAMDLAAGVMGQQNGKTPVVNALKIRGKDQVMLKVTVAEIQRSVLKQLGINFDGSWNIGDAAINAVTANPFSLQRQLLSSSGISGSLNGGKQKFDAKALERQSVLRTLAEPTLTAISGESAKFVVGGEIPVPANQTCDSTLGRNICNISIQYRTVGVTLNFTPVVMSENLINIRVATEVTEVDADNQIVLNNLTIPGFRTRKAETTVELPSGGVLATAGLIQQQSKQHINGLPGLMNLPILGSLFRSRDYQRSETELIILVQPFIAKPSAPGDIVRPDDGFADASDPSTVFMNRLNKSYGGPNSASAQAQQRNIAPRSNNARVGFITD